MGNVKQLAPRPLAMKSARSVDRAIDVLLEFINAPMMGIQDLEHRLGLPKATLYRMLAGLEQKGLVSSFGDPRRFRLGPKALSLSIAWRQSFNISTLSEPVLLRLYQESNETVVLSVPHDRENRIAVREFRSTQPITFARREGYIAPLYAGAAGKAILAFFPQHHIDAILESLESDTARKKLRADLEKIRRDGHWVSRSERVPGAASVGAPIFGHDGSVQGAVCLLMPQERLREEKIVRLVTTAARDISIAAGYIAS